eukprot:UN05428
MSNRFSLAMAQTEIDKGTIIVWGKEAAKTRFISIKGETDVNSLLKVVTATTIQHLLFLDGNGIRFGDVNGYTQVREIGEFDAKQRLWTVRIIPKLQMAKQTNNIKMKESDDNKTDGIHMANTASTLVQRCHISHNNVIYSEHNQIVWNQTTPQNNQGIEALRLKIKPKFKSSTLRIHANLIGRRETTISMAALFRNDNKNSVYSICNNGPCGWFVPIVFDYEMQSCVLDEILISIRISGYALNGRKGGSTVFNGT